MKATHFVLILSLLIGLSLCRKESYNYKSLGIILGPDVRDCACCGGWYIKIDTTEYEFDELPDNTNIDLEKETFPLNVKLDWQLSDRLPCTDKRITISRITKY